MNTDQKFNWREFEQRLREEGKTTLSLGIAPSPCESCPRGGGEGCHKPVNPDVHTSCRRWAEWFYQVWPVLRGKIRGDRYV